MYNVNSEAWYNVVYVLCDSYAPQRHLLAQPEASLLETISTTSAVTAAGEKKAPSRLLRKKKSTGGDSFVFTVAKIEGSVTFRNPYGFLPGELYGLLPFEVSR